MPPREIRVNISSPTPSQGSLDQECTICLSPIHNTERVLMERCTHSFHRECIHNWHRTERRNQRPLSCPICRTVGPVAISKTPIFKLNGGLFGPWGQVELYPDQIVVRAKYLFSHTNKQSIYYINIGGFFKSGRCVILVDRHNEVISTFYLKRCDEFFKELGKATTKFYDNNRTRFAIQRPTFLET